MVAGADCVIQADAISAGGLTPDLRALIGALPVFVVDVGQKITRKRGILLNRRIRKGFDVDELIVLVHGLDFEGDFVTAFSSRGLEGDRGDQQHSHQYEAKQLLHCVFHCF